MKSTDKAAQETAKIVKPEDPFRHAKQYVARELAQYPIYKQRIDDTRAEINEIRNHVALQCKVTDGSGGGGAALDSVQEFTVRIAILEANIEHYRWRIAKTEEGLKYFGSNKELMDLITQKYFICNDWDNTMIMAKLGYSTRPGRYYMSLKKILEMFGKFYGVMP